MSPQIQMVIAGICLASWQILVNLSGMPGPVANLWVLILSALFAVATAGSLTSTGNLGILGGLTAVLFLGVVVVFRHVVPVSAVTYLLGATAGVLSGVAVWQLNDVLGSVPKSAAGPLLMLMVSSQLTTVATNHVGMQIYLAGIGAVSLRTLAAFVLATAAGFLLYR